jgi:hypothetical protein
MEIRNEAERKWMEEFIKQHTSEGTALINREPTTIEIQSCMAENKLTYYGAREFLREQSYGGKPPEGFQSWGDYHKSR